MSSVPFFVIFIVVVVGYALARGGGPERATALAYIIASAGSLSLGFLNMPGAFRSVPMRLFAVDTLLLIGLCIVAIRANRRWPIPVAGCQLVAVLVHAGKLLYPAMIPDSYALLTTIWSWPMVALLGIGTWAHRRRLAERAFVPDWKPISGRLRFRSPPLQLPR
ncbi:hypothetical protein [Sphingomonas segetis]|jgi:cytochrome bd-type quinol oxidase subunit 2|uniref:hypothetical protein n=1 Tax=Sphingomonas segetis TaxID=1104779 RepID=UPI0018AD3DB0|nr:hypothetical protein [Sphingomonas segetis]